MKSDMIFYKGRYEVIAVIESLLWYEVNKKLMREKG